MHPDSPEATAATEERPPSPPSPAAPTPAPAPPPPAPAAATGASPSIGRIVHYVAPFGHRAAIITSRTAGSADAVNLQIFRDGGDPTDVVPFHREPAFACDVQHDAHGALGTWHWPERE